MAANQDLLAKFHINPEDIPTGEEMSKYIGNIGDQIKDEGLVYYNKKSNKPCGIASTKRGIKFFGPLVEDSVAYQGELTEDYYPHGRGSLYNGKTLLRSNFIYGCINDVKAFAINDKGYREACFLSGMLLY